MDAAKVPACSILALQLFGFFAFKPHKFQLLKPFGDGCHACKPCALVPWLWDLLQSSVAEENEPRGVNLRDCSELIYKNQGYRSRLWTPLAKVRIVQVQQDILSSLDSRLSDSKHLSGSSSNHHVESCSLHFCKSCFLLPSMVHLCRIERSTSLMLWDVIYLKSPTFATQAPMGPQATPSSAIRSSRPCGIHLKTRPRG